MKIGVLLLGALLLFCGGASAFVLHRSPSPLAGSRPHVHRTGGILLYAPEKEEEAEYVPLTMDEFSEDTSPVAFGLVLAYLGGGLAVYSQQTDWSLLDAAYFVIVTLTSVGYGDLTPATPELKLFTSAYILLGVGLVGTLLGELLASLLDVDGETAPGQLLRFLAGLGGPQRADGDGAADGEDPRDRPLDALLVGEDPRAQLVGSLSAVGAALLLGTLGFGRLEGLGWVDALYCSVATVTTVGYGDAVPTSAAGKAFASAYALFGVFLVARSLGAVAALPLDARQRAQQRRVLQQYGEELDAEEFTDLQTTMSELGLCISCNGCSRSDFAIAMLVRQDKVNEVDVKQCIAVFDGLDADGSGQLDEEDVALFERQQQEKELASRLSRLSRRSRGGP